MNWTAFWTKADWENTDNRMNKTLKLSLTLLLLVLLSFGWSRTSHSFDLGGLMKDLERSTRPPAKTQPEPVSEPTQEQAPAEQGGGGLIGLGDSLGLFDKRTSKLLRQGVSTLKALQPIGLKEEKAIGGALAVEVFNRFGGPYNNKHLQRYLNLIGRSLADVSNRPDIDYHFAVLNTSVPNAFAAPGGYVFVSLGLLNLIRNEAQLAGVLGHEIAHISKKHALQTLERSQSMKGLTSLTLTVMDKDPGLFDKVIGEVANLLFTKGLDKNLEFEADKYGTEFAYRLGYFPGGLKDFVRILGKNIRSSEGSVFLSTHPTPRERYRQLSKLMNRYQAAILYPTLVKRYQSTFKGRS